MPPPLPPPPAPPTPPASEKREPPLQAALHGKGLPDMKTYVLVALLPSVAVLAGLHAVLNATNVYAVAVVACVNAWVVPLASLAKLFTDLDKIRSVLLECAPLLPGLIPYLPQLAPPLILNVHRVLPYAGDLAPYLPPLLKHPAFVATALPKLLRKVEIMAPLIPQVGPKFAEMDERHFAKLELVLDDLVDQIEELLPYFPIIAPHIVPISLRADRLFPVVRYLIPHADKMKDHIGWLVDFADVEGFEEFLPFIDKLAPYVEEFAPHGPKLLPYIPKMRGLMPILLDNIDTLAPQLGAVVDNIDPLVYWLSDWLPLADKLGLLRSKLLVQAGTPFARFLPSVPAQSGLPPLPLQPGSYSNESVKATSKSKHVPTEQNDVALFRMSAATKSVRLPRTTRFKGVDYYVLELNNRYAGEFRYSHLKELHKLARQLMAPYVELDAHALDAMPEFPPRKPLNPHTTDFLETRRRMLERYLAWVFSTPEICNERPFLAFVRQRRRWSQPLPLMASPFLPTS